MFSGKAGKTAVLEFAKKYALWVSDKSCHPNQKGEWLRNGTYRLTIPYHNSQELIMDILKYGADVEVIEPPDLRQQLIETLKKMKKIYQLEITTSQDEEVLLS